MMVLDHEITAFACLSNGYLTVVESVNILRNSSESRLKVVSGCVGKLYNFSVFSVPVKNLVRGFVLWDF